MLAKTLLLQPRRDIRMAPGAWRQRAEDSSPALLQEHTGQATERRTTSATPTYESIRRNRVVPEGRDSK